MDSWYGDVYGIVIDKKSLDLPTYTIKPLCQSWAFSLNCLIFGHLSEKMKNVYVIDAVRTPIGKYGGALAAVRPDDLLAYVIRTLLVTE